MVRRELHENWTLSGFDQGPDFPQPQLQWIKSVPATVPGSVHLDLMEAGVLADPFYRRQEHAAAWVDHQDWTYETRFDWTPLDGLPRRVLRFACLDAVAEVFLNGEHVGASDNMFLPLEIDVTARLIEGENTLRVEFKSAVNVGTERRHAYFEQENIPWGTKMFDERAFVRKAQYMSGWDWGPRLVSAGIAGPVELLEFAGRIVEVSFLQEQLPSGNFRVWAEAKTEGLGQLEFEVEGQRFGEGESIELAPNLWWPAGEGPQTLHRATATFGDHRVHKQIGLRMIELRRERDEDGRSFEFVVNGRAIYARGANWIPDDSFISRVEATDLRRIKRYVALGVNMLRVWGGGFYESEAFYDACDAAGILVWQDFPYACSYYPDSDPQLEIAYAEAAHHVRRLRDRASLALWCGNNENEVMWRGPWGGPETAPARYYGERLYNEALPRAVRDFGNGTGYIPTSPMGFEVEDPAISDRAERFGDSHYWDVWHGRGDWKFYDESETRFSSEYGFASSPSLDVWRATLSRQDWTPDSPVVWHHDKTGKGEETFRGFVDLHYPTSITLEDWTYYSQLNQRDAMRHGVEHFRRSAFCRGSLIWQMNDCWPSQSWALEDYHRLLKPAGQELARLYAPVMASIVLTEETAEFWLINDSPDTANVRVTIEAVDTVTGASWGLQAPDVVLVSRGRMMFQEQSLEGFDRNQTALVVRIDDRPETARWAFLCEPKELKLGAPTISAQVGNDVLLLEIEGFVADLVVWDDANPHAVLGPYTQLPGWAPVTAANTTLIYPLSDPVVRLMARSLAGWHTS